VTPAGEEVAVPIEVVWVALGVVILVGSLLASRSDRARIAARVATALLFIPAGALYNLAHLLGGDDYSGFADSSSSAFVRETWQSLVVPHHTFFIGLLVAFETAVGVLVLLGGRWTRVGLVAAIVFHVALLSFGWIYLPWAVIAVMSFSLQLRAERRAPRRVRSSGPGTMEA